MSGPENLKGFDYQICYSLLRSLEYIKDGISIDAIQFESIDENEEDFNIISGTNKEYHQVKKRIEGNHWTPGDLKEIFEKFITKDDGKTIFYFVTDGTANPEVKKLRDHLDSKKNVGDNFLIQFLPEGKSLNELRRILARIIIRTRFFSSDDDTNPAKNLKHQILQILSQPPFDIKGSIESCYSSLWKLLFDLSRDAKPVMFEMLIQQFEKKDLHIQKTPWFDAPDISDFLGREEELEVIKNELIKTHKLIVYGINGIGKTWTSLKSVLDLFPNNVCWIKVNFWTSIDHVNFNVVSLLHSKGYQIEATMLQNVDLANRVQILLKILERVSITIVIDSINSASNELIKFVEQLIELALSKKILGNIIVTSTRRIACYSEIDVKNENISIYDLKGLSLEDTRLLLHNIVRAVPVEEFDKIYKTLGGHPMSIFFLKQLVDNKVIDTKNFTSVEFETIEATRDWILSKSILNLPPVDKDSLLKLSLFQQDITEEEIIFILNSPTKPKYLLRNLLDNHLVSINEGHLVMHDSIREVTRNMLSIEFKMETHKKLSEFYFAKMQSSINANNGADYEDILKWGYHLEQLEGCNLLEERYELILLLKNDEIAALGAINKFGYPFDFETEDLSFSQTIVDILLDMHLIEANNDPERKRLNSPVEFVLINIDFWQKCFISYLCLSRELPYDMGYVSIFKPNHSWNLQKASCQWEHCIEFMPLPPITKSEKADHIKFLKGQFENGAYDDKTDEQKASLQSMIDEGVSDKIPDERNIEMEACRCPIWGHCCPDGKEQAEECRQELLEYETSK